MTVESMLLLASVLLLLSILASKASHWLGIPALLLFLLVGMLAGSDGPGGVYFDNPWLAQSLGVAALALILFAGGFDTDWRRVRPVLPHGLALATVGVVLTATLVGVFATACLGFSRLEGLLLGAIVSSTDAAATFTVLRSRRVRLRGSLEPLLELESGSNDPMAVFLTIGLTRLLVDPALTAVDMLPMFALQMTLGAALGYGLGRAMLVVVNRLRLEAEGLYPVLTLALVLFTYGLTAWVGGNGFLAVYLAGLVLGKHDFVHKHSLRRFHDGLAWLMQIAMFLTLGLQVFPSRLVPIAGMGLAVAAVLLCVARPVSVFLSLLPTGLPWREKTMVAWVGLRGAAPIILATFPLLAGLPRAELMFNVVFFIVLTSVLIQGTSLPLVARWLGVDVELPPTPRYPLEFVPTGQLQSALTEVAIASDSAAVGRQVVDLGLPEGALIVLISRGSDFLVPGGSTVLEAGDRLLVLADNAALAAVKATVGPGPA